VTHVAHNVYFALRRALLYSSAVSWRVAKMCAHRAFFAYFPHANKTNYTKKHHPSKHGPKGGAIPLQERFGRRFVWIRGAVGRRRCNELRYAHTNCNAKLCTCVEYSTAQGLHVSWKTVGYNEKAKSKQDVTIDRSKDLVSAASVTWT
jgi:hypothetical protein